MYERNLILLKIISVDESIFLGFFKLKSDIECSLVVGEVVLLSLGGFRFINFLAGIFTDIKRQRES